MMANEPGLVKISVNRLLIVRKRITAMIVAPQIQTAGMGFPGSCAIDESNMGHPLR
jgi:hypothetical protein